VSKAGFTPGVNARLTRLAVDQTVAERQCGLGALTFIAGAHGGAFVVVHQRQVKGGGHRALGKFYRRANVD
jgi:hypothetical protein